MKSYFFQMSLKIRFCSQINVDTDSESIKPAPVPPNAKQLPLR